MKEIRISQKSWHYRLVQHYEFPSSNLCNYFWQVVLFSLLTFFLVLVSAIGAFFIIYPLAGALFALFGVGWLPLDDFWLSIYALDVGIFCIFAVSAMRHWNVERRMFYKAREIGLIEASKSYTEFQESTSFLSMFWHLVKAKKEKFCPKINFYD